MPQNAGTRAVGPTHRQAVDGSRVTERGIQGDRLSRPSRVRSGSLFGDGAQIRQVRLPSSGVFPCEALAVG